MFPDDLVEDIKAANNVYEVISEYVPLKKVGSAWRGLCPFHAEKTPSFYVNPDRQIYHCFGCRAGGDVINFLMQYDRVTFPEAVARLAARAGISLPEKERRADGEEGLKKAILTANDKALQFFRQQLDGKGGEAARRYLAGRGIGPETVERFRLGWSPPGWDGLRDHLRKSGFGDDLLVKAGLAAARQDGSGCYDRFRGRVIFPIAAPMGETLAFGGRVIAPEGEPKYLNSPETPVYHKGRVLYGLDLARGKVRETGIALVVEGYLDLIAAHLAGAGNAVATLGTALTRDHLRLLKRYAGKAVMVYDGDTAGMEAATRSLGLFLDEDLPAACVVLPDGHDPDSLVRERGEGALREAIDRAVPLMDFFMERTVTRWRGEGTDGKARASAEILPALARVGSHVARSEYLRKLAGLLDVREEALAAELRSRGGQAPASGHGPPRPRRARCAEEEELVRGMLLDRALAGRIRDEVPLASFRDEACRAVAAAVYEDLERRGPGGGSVSPSLEEPRAASLAARLLAEEEELIRTMAPPAADDPQARELARVEAVRERAGQLGDLVDDCLGKIRKTRQSRELRELQEKIRRAEADRRPDIVDELLRIKQSLAKA